MLAMEPTTAERLEAARQTAGHNGRPLSYTDLRDAVRDRLGPLTPTAETLRQLHRNDGNATPDPVLIAAIADVYGLPLVDVAPDIVDQAKRLDVLLRRAIRSRCSDPGAPRDLPGFDGGVWCGTAPLLAPVPARDVPVRPRMSRARVGLPMIEERVA